MTIKWLLQNNLVDRMTGQLAIALRESGRDMRDFSYAPGEPLPDLLDYPEQPHFLYGSTGMILSASKDSRYKAQLFFDEANYDCLVWSAFCRRRMLNVGMVKIWRDLKCGISTPTFIRPISYGKSFSGTLVNPESLSAWIQDQKYKNPKIMPRSLIWAAPAQKILEEYRFIVFNREIITGSRYRLNDALSKSADIPKEAWDAARQLALGWQPDALTVMDICRLNDNIYKIVEFNTIHTSGLYDIPLPDFINAVERALQ